MSRPSVLCPRCGSAIPVSGALRSGDVMTCLQCGGRSRIPSAAPLAEVVVPARGHGGANYNAVILALSVAGGVVAVGAIVLMATIYVSSRTRGDTRSATVASRSQESPVARATPATNSDARSGADSLLSSLPRDTRPGSTPTTRAQETPAASTEPATANEATRSPSVVSKPSGDGPDRALPPPAAAVEKLRYGWKAGDKHMYSYSLDAEVSGIHDRQFGQSSYTVRTRSKSTSFGGSVEEMQGTGSGFVVAENGYIVTCEHVVVGTVKIVVHVDGQQYDGEVVAMDKAHDLAIVRIPASGLTALPLADSDAVELAQEVRAVGYPLSNVLGSSLKITRGSVAGFVEDGDNRLLQVDAAINPGNSGGPVVNEQGEAVGVASAKLADESISNVGFVVPANYAKALLRKHAVGFSTHGSTERMEGPELARRVMPSTAFLEVTKGPDGVGAEDRYVLDFHGTLAKELRADLRNGGPPPGLVGVPSVESGKVLADVAGEIHDLVGEVELPFLFGPIGQIGIEPLPPEGETNWKTERSLAITRVEEDSGPASRRPSSSPFSRSRSRFGSVGRSVQVVVIPAMERVVYELQPPEGDRVVIKKSYELRSLTDENSDGAFQMSGEGTVVFDRSLGVPTKMEFKATFSRPTSNTPLSIPIQYSYERIDSSRSTAASTAASREDGRDARDTSGNGLATPSERSSPANPRSEPTLDEHLATLRSRSANFTRKYIALNALVRAEPVESKRREVAVLLEGLLSDGNQSLQQTAIKAIGVWGSETNLPALLPMLEDSDLGTRWAVLRSLGKIGGETAAKAVAAHMANGSNDMLTAGRALRDMGPSAESATLGLLKHDDVQVRMQACHILGEIGTRKSLATLRSQKANDPHISGRSAADIAIRNIERRG